MKCQNVKAWENHYGMLSDAAPFVDIHALLGALSSNCKYGISVIQKLRC